MAAADAYALGNTVGKGFGRDLNVCDNTHSLTRKPLSNMYENWKEGQNGDGNMTDPIAVQTTLWV
jgi:hypothetical protein